MGPTLKAGDKVFLERILPEALKAGDLLAFDNPKNRIPSLHRLLWIGKAHVLTAGDAHWRVDSAVPFSSLLGRVLRVEPGNRTGPFAAPSFGLLRWTHFTLKKILLKSRESDSLFVRKMFSFLSFLWIKGFIRKGV